MMSEFPNTTKHVFINQIQPGMKNINTTFVVLDMGSVHRTQQGSDIRTVRVADQTGSINVCLWNEQSEHVGVRKVFSIRNGFATMHKGRLSLSFAKSGEISKPLDMNIAYVESPDMSAYSSENDVRPAIKRPLSGGDDDTPEALPTRKHASVNEQSASNKYIQINQLQPGMKSVNLLFIVTDIGNPRQTSQGNEVRTIRVADHTGSVLMSVWNELGEFVKTGDILRLRGGCVTVYKGSMGLQVAKSGEVLKTGEFFLPFAELPDMSAFNKDLIFELSATGANGCGGPPAKILRDESIGS